MTEWLGHTIEAALLFLKDHGYNHEAVRSAIQSRTADPCGVFVGDPDDKMACKLLDGHDGEHSV